MRTACLARRVHSSRATPRTSTRRTSTAWLQAEGVDGCSGDRSSGQPRHPAGGCLEYRDRPRRRHGAAFAGALKRGGWHWGGVASKATARAEGAKGPSGAFGQSLHKTTKNPANNTDTIQTNGYCPRLYPIGMHTAAPGSPFLAGAAIVSLPGWNPARVLPSRVRRHGRRCGRHFPCLQPTLLGAGRRLHRPHRRRRVPDRAANHETLTQASRAISIRFLSSEIAIAE